MISSAEASAGRARCMRALRMGFFLSEEERPTVVDGVGFCAEGEGDGGEWSTSTGGVVSAERTASSVRGVGSGAVSEAMEGEASVVRDSVILEVVS